MFQTIARTHTHTHTHTHEHLTVLLIELIGYDDSGSLDIVKVDTEDTATSTDQIMETVEVNH